LKVLRKHYVKMWYCFTIVFWAPLHAMNKKLKFFLKFQNDFYEPKLSDLCNRFLCWMSFVWEPFPDLRRKGFRGPDVKRRRRNRTDDIRRSIRERPKKRCWDRKPKYFFKGLNLLRNRHLFWQNLQVAGTDWFCKRGMVDWN
jgi:hypothetical protein